jgi:hypothetical protein
MSDLADDKTVTLTLVLLEGREFDFWTNRMFIETLRDLADLLESECEKKDLDETLKTVDH